MTDELNRCDYKTIYEVWAAARRVAVDRQHARYRAVLEQIAAGEGGLALMAREALSDPGS